MELLSLLNSFGLSFCMLRFAWKGDLAITALEFRSEGRWFESDLCRRVVSLDKKLYSTLSLFAQVSWVPVIKMLGSNLAMDYV